MTKKEQAKKAASDKVKEILERELKDCNRKIQSNKYSFARLAAEQTILKRERVKITQLIRELD